MIGAHSLACASMATVQDKIGFLHARCCGTTSHCSVVIPFKWLSSSPLVRDVIHHLPTQQVDD